MLQGDISDGFFSSQTKSKKYPNPFFGVPLQYLPTNMDGMLWWSEQFLMRFGFYRSAISRVADYFITQISIDCEDEESEEEYRKIFEELGWKKILQEAGLNLLAYSNTFISINQGFNRFLCCPKCKKFTIIDRIQNYKFEKGDYFYKCLGCSYDGIHRLVDKPVKDVKKINTVCWNPREIKLKHEETSNTSVYFWEIPKTYSQKVTKKGDHFYSKVVPKVIYDAIFEKKMIEFNNKNFIHLKLPTPASLKTDGKAVPLAMYMFDNFFMLKVLERYNEVICFEDINPFRVISMADNTPASNPIFESQDGGAWAAAVDNMLDAHTRDPASYHKFPFSLNFQHLGGDAKNLTPVELINFAQSNILNALNIPQEFYNMTLQTQAVGPALRLFENSWSSIPDNYNILLQKIGDVVCKIRGLTPAKFTLLPITFADDMERKSVIGQLVSSNSIARSEFLKLYGFEYKDQIRKKLEEEQASAEIQEEEQKKQQLKQLTSTSIFGQPGQPGGPGMPPATPGENVGNGQGSNPQDILRQAQEIAQQLQAMDGPGRRTELQKIKAQSETLWSSVKSQLQQMDQGVKSDALKQSKQQQ